LYQREDLDQGLTGKQTEDDADDQGDTLHAVMRGQPKCDFVALLRRWIAETNSV
jgi:hypothetical protein